MALETRARPINMNYIAIVMQPGATPAQTVMAWVPETFQLSLKNDWQPIFGQFNDAIGGVSQGARGLGVTVNVKAFTQQIWVGTEPLEFQFTFMFDAYYSTYDDVQVPIESLISMATPISDSIFLTAPGPNIIDNTLAIQLRIGNFFFIDSVVITDLDITWYTISDITGGFQSADVNITFRSAYTPDKNDILNYFAFGRAGKGGFIYQNAAQKNPNTAKNLGLDLLKKTLGIPTQ